MARKPDPKQNARSGYHHWPWGGSFEVFWVHGQGNDPGCQVPPGWYWWACFPGCLPDGEADGPYRSSTAAYAAARGAR